MPVVIQPFKFKIESKKKVDGHLHVTGAGLKMGRTFQAGDVRTVKDKKTGMERTIKVKDEGSMAAVWRGNAARVATPKGTGHTVGSSIVRIKTGYALKKKKVQTKSGRTVQKKVRVPQFKYRIASQWYNGVKAYKKNKAAFEAGRSASYA